MLALAGSNSDEQAALFTAHCRRQVAVLELSAGLYAVRIWRAINQKKAIVMRYDDTLAITVIGDGVLGIGCKL